MKSFRNEAEAVSVLLIRYSHPFNENKGKFMVDFKNLPLSQFSKSGLFELL